MERQKQALIEALSRKGTALCRLYFQNDLKHNLESNTDEKSAKSLEAIDNLLKDILKFAESTDSKVNNFSSHCNKII